MESIGVTEPVYTLSSEAQTQLLFLCGLKEKYRTNTTIQTKLNELINLIQELPENQEFIFIQAINLPVFRF